MSNNIRTKSSLLLEDFDIKALCEKCPNQRIGVNVSRIYIQIAKFNQNPLRLKELRILKKAVAQSSNKYNYDAHYTIMELQDFVACFGVDLKKMPKYTWALTHSAEFSDK